MRDIILTYVDAIKCNPIIVAVGVVSGGIASLFGGWDMGLNTLVVLMLVDYFTGLIVAGVFKKSTKTENGGLESKAGWRGLCKKAMTLVIILVAHKIDMLLGKDIARDATIICYTVNEILSIIENAGLMGVPIPKAISNAVELLKHRAGESEEDEERN